MVVVVVEREGINDGPWQFLGVGFEGWDVGFVDECDGYGVAGDHVLAHEFD